MCSRYDPVTSRVLMTPHVEIELGKVMLSNLTIFNFQNALSLFYLYAALAILVIGIITGKFII